MMVLRELEASSVVSQALPVSPEVTDKWALNKVLANKAGPGQVLHVFMLSCKRAYIAFYCFYP